MATAQYSLVTEDKIRKLAYQIYEFRGRVDGFAHEDWIVAEAEVLVEEQGGESELEGECCEAGDPLTPEAEPEKA
jgi:hypothetical protein